MTFRQATLERQDLSCMYLALRELESVLVVYSPVQSRMYDESQLPESHPKPERYSMKTEFAGIASWDDFSSFGWYGHDLKGLHACGLNSAAIAVYVACSEAG